MADPDTKYDEERDLPPATEVVFELRIELVGPLPEDAQILDEMQLMQNVLMAARSADLEDDALVRIVGVNVVRVS